MTRRISRGRRLLLEASVSSTVPRFELREQPHVLDGDHRLGGEGLGQLDLLVRERAGLLASRRTMHPDGYVSRAAAAWPAASESRSVERCSRTRSCVSGNSRAQTPECPRRGSFGDPEGPRARSRDRAAANREGPADRRCRRLRPMHGDEPESLRLRGARSRHRSRRRIARRFRPRRPSPAGGRSASWMMTRRISAVAVCCSRASVSSRFRASSSVNSRTFSIAITAWSANVCSQLDLLVRERPRLDTCQC